MIPSWAGRYTGIPFREKGRDLSGFDCWGLVRHALRCERGLTLPSYEEHYDSCESREDVPEAIREGLAEEWERVEQPSPFDLVIFKIAGRPMHVGLVVEHPFFLHMLDRPGSSSVVERYTDAIWCRRVEGFYRRRGAAGNTAG